LIGGKFRDGALQGAVGQLANEVSSYIDTQLNCTNMSDTQRSVMTLLSKASASAIRVLGNPGDPAVGFATELLSALISPQSAATADAPTDEALVTASDGSEQPSDSPDASSSAESGDIPQAPGVSAEDEANATTADAPTDEV
jgi:hypothetical protein